MTGTKNKATAKRKPADDVEFGAPPKRTGQTPTNAVLTAAKVKKARLAFKDGWNMNALATKLGVTWPTVRDAITGKTWAKAGGPIFPDGKR